MITANNVGAHPYHQISVADRIEQIDIRIVDLERQHFIACLQAVEEQTLIDPTTGDEPDELAQHMDSIRQIELRVDALMRVRDVIQQNNQ